VKAYLGSSELTDGGSGDTKPGQTEPGAAHA
jgi:hypothetical protein